MFRKLLWKEWHENRWKLTFGATISFVFTAMLSRTRLFPEAANCLIISFSGVVIKVYITFIILFI